MSKSAGDMKQGRIASTVKDGNTIQKDLDSLKSWAGANRIKFTAEKWKVLHLGRIIQKYSYKMGDTWLDGSTTEARLDSDSEEDMGILVV